MGTRQGLDDALPTIADVYPPSKPIFSFYPRGADRTRTFPRGKELGYFNKQYSDGCVPARAACAAGRAPRTASAHLDLRAACITRGTSDSASDSVSALSGGLGPACLNTDRPHTHARARAHTQQRDTHAFQCMLSYAIAAVR